MIPRRALELNQTFRVIPKWVRGTEAVSLHQPVPGYGLPPGKESNLGSISSLQPRVIPRVGYGYGSRGMDVRRKGAWGDNSSIHYSTTFVPLRSTSILHLNQKKVLQDSGWSHFLAIYRQRIMETNHTSYCYS